MREQRDAGAYSNEVAWALAELIAKQKFDPDIEWVTCVPSLRNPALVPDLAQRAADRPRLPFVPVVPTPRDTAPPG